MITFSSNHHHNSSHSRLPQGGGHSSRRGSHSHSGKVGMSPKTKFRIGLASAFIAGCSWLTHFAQGQLLKNDIVQRQVTDTLFPGVSRKVDGLRKAINKGFEVDTSMHPYRVDTIKIPDNIRGDERGSFTSFITPFFKTPALTPENVRARLVKLEDGRLANSFSDDYSSGSKYFHVQIGDTVLFDKDENKHLIVKYYSDNK